jgi:putative MFS transporter
MVIGVIQSFGGLGSVVCAAVVPLILKTPFGWRGVYFVGGLPLILIAFARRSIQETRRFDEQGGSSELFGVLRSPYRGRALKLGLIWAFTFIGTQNAITFWKEFALKERGLSESQIGASVAIAALVAMPLIFLASKLLDWIGRRRSAMLIYPIVVSGVFLSYTLSSWAALTAALVLGILGIGAVAPVLNAFTTELFPTRLRSSAFAWTNNVMGRTAPIFTPAVLGSAAGVVGWGPAVASTALFPLIAFVLVLLLLPETRGKELEETSAL